MYKLIKSNYPYFSYKKANKKSKGTIFFIHGYAVNSNYHNLFSDKIDDYDYYAVEHAGHGITPLKNKKQLNPWSFALETSELIKELDLKDIILIGHSMGGGIAMMLLQLIPDRIKKMVLVTPMNSKGTTKIFNFLFRFNPKSEKQAKRFYKLILHSSNRQKSLILEEDVKNLIDYQIKNKKNMNILKRNMVSLKNLRAMKKGEKNINVETLLLVGSGDGCINSIATKNNFKANKNIKTYEFKKSGHLPFLEENELYIKIIRDFINK